LARHKKKPPKWYIGSPVLFSDEDTSVLAVRSPDISQMPYRTDTPGLRKCQGKRSPALQFDRAGYPAYIHSSTRLPAAGITMPLKILMVLKSSNG
jgi:hypothetical protein